MKKSYSLILLAAIVLLGMQNTLAQEKTFTPGSFEQVIISPHIEVIFEKADQESVVMKTLMFLWIN